MHKTVLYAYMPNILVNMCLAKVKGSFFYNTKEVEL